MLLGGVLPMNTDLQVLAAKFSNGSHDHTQLFPVFPGAGLASGSRLCRRGLQRKRVELVVGTGLGGQVR